MKEHKKIIFNFKNKIFQTEDFYMGGKKYKDLNYWSGDKFRFAESKKNWGVYSRKNLNKITEDIKRYEKMGPQIINEKELEFRVAFLSKKGNWKSTNSTEIITQIVKAANPVMAVEKALTKSGLFAEDIIKTEISRFDNKDITDVNLVEIDSRDYKGKEEVKMADKVTTIKDLSNKFGIEGKRIRIIARKLGLKPNPTEEKGFGPKKKYEWEKDSKELKKIVTALQEEVKE